MCTTASLNVISAWWPSPSTRSPVLRVRFAPGGSKTGLKPAIFAPKASICGTSFKFRIRRLHAFRYRYSTGVAEFTRKAQTWGSCIDYFLCVRSSLRTVAITLEYFIRVYAYEYAVQMYCTVLYMSTSTVLNSHWELNNSFVCAVFTHGIDAPVNYCLRKLSNASRVL